MYLIVFVTMVVSMLNLYTQVYALQVARMNAQQTGVAETLLQWHNAAVREARTAKATLTAGVCQVMDNTTTWAIKLSAPVTTCAFSITPANDLPPGYQLGTYRFKTIVYVPTTGTTSYVITYLETPTVTTGITNGSITLSPTTPLTWPSAGTTSIQIGLTMNDLMRQMTRTKIPAFGYGTVMQLDSTNIGYAKAGITYKLPSGTLPLNALAVISPI